MRLKREGRDGDLSPAPRAEVKNGWIYSSTPVYAAMARIGRIQTTTFLLHNRSFVATLYTYRVASFGVTIRSLLSVPPPEQPTLCPHSARMTIGTNCDYFLHNKDTK